MKNGENVSISNSGFEDFNSNWSSAHPRDSKQHRISEKHSRIFVNRWVILWSVFLSKCDSKSSDSCQEQKSCYNLMKKINSFSWKESVRLNYVHSNEMIPKNKSLHNDSERRSVKDNKRNVTKHVLPWLQNSLHSFLTDVWEIRRWIMIVWADVRIHTFTVKKSHYLLVSWEPIWPVWLCKTMFSMDRLLPACRCRVWRVWFLELFF